MHQGSPELVRVGGQACDGPWVQQPLLGHGHPVSWLPYELPAGDDRQVSSQERRSDAPICQDKRLGCLRDVSAHAKVCHNTLVDFTGEEAFEAADDLASGPAASRPAGDVVDRRLVEPHADDDRAMEGGVRL